MPIYHERPRQRMARKAWDYFMKHHPTKIRRIELGYTPNYHGDGPGWIWDLGHIESDTLHWHGSESITFFASKFTIEQDA